MSYAILSNRHKKHVRKKKKSKNTTLSKKFENIVGKQKNITPSALFQHTAEKQKNITPCTCLQKQNARRVSMYIFIRNIQVQFISTLKH
jgi:hypothetical protein